MADRTLKLIAVCIIAFLLFLIPQAHCTSITNSPSACDSGGAGSGIDGGGAASGTDGGGCGNGWKFLI